MYETFEHTADLGLRIRAPDLNTLFAEAGLAIFSALVENLDAVRPTQIPRGQADRRRPGVPALRLAARAIVKQSLETVRSSRVRQCDPFLRRFFSGSVYN